MTIRFVENIRELISQYEKPVVIDNGILVRDKHTICSGCHHRKVTRVGKQTSNPFDYLCGTCSGKVARKGHRKADLENED